MKLDYVVEIDLPRNIARDRIMGRRVCKNDALWEGIGILFITLFSVLLFDESLSLMKIAGLTTLVAGIVLIKSGTPYPATRWIAWRNIAQNRQRLLRQCYKPARPRVKPGATEYQARHDKLNRRLPFPRPLLTRLLCRAGRPARRRPSDAANIFSCADAPDDKKTPRGRVWEVLTRS